jgi:hypothetical protein
MLADDSTPPKKRKQRTQKKSKPTLLPLDTNSEDPHQLEQVIARAFKQFYTNSVSKQNKIKDLKHLDVIVAEYLQCFMILGYDLSGEKICISHASTPAARDALIEHMRSTFLNVMNGNGNGNE